MQEAVALLRAVAAERFLLAHFRHGLGHRVDDDRCQRQGHIADAHADDLLFRMGLLEGRHLFRDVGE